MNSRISLLVTVILISIAALASGQRKTRFLEYGFAASFPDVVVRTNPLPDVALFAASPPGGAWTAQVRVSDKAALPKEITNEVMEAKLAQILKDGGMTQTGSSSYGKFQGYPCVAARATYILNNENTYDVSYSVVVDMKVIFVPGKDRIYMDDGLAIQGSDRSGIRPFLDSFELR